MTVLQEKAVKLVMQIPDDSTILRLISFIENISINRKTNQESIGENQKRQAFQRLDTAWNRIEKYYPDGFDEKTEYAEAMRDRYGYTD